MVIYANSEGRVGLPVFSIAQSVACLTTDRLIASEFQFGHRSFVEIDNEIISKVILSLPLIQEGHLVSYWQNCVHKVLVNHLRGLSLPRKSVSRLTDMLFMTLTVLLGPFNSN